MKIEFKELKKVNLSEIFPIISEEDYKLLQGLSLILPDEEYNKIQKQGYLNIGPQQISKDLIQIAAGESFDPIQMEVQEEVSKRMIFSDKMVDILCRAVKLNKNVILYGRGGHNKSEGTMDVLHQLKMKGILTEEPFVQAFGDGLTEESLFGGINIKKFKDSGELEYLFKNSFMEHEVVIFEEIFDAPPQVLLSLKDILTSGYCRKGNQIHKSKTKVIIGLTNKSKEDFSEDDSLEALAQRFPLTLKVEWDNYGKNDWEKLFKTVFGNEYFNENRAKFRDLVEILAINNQANDASFFVSPRTAVHAAALYCDGGSLNYISDINPKIVADYFKANKDREQTEADENMFKMVANYVKDNGIEEVDTNAKVLELILNEHTKRTGENINLNIDKTDNKVKAAKLEYVLGLMDIHNWSKQNIERASKKKQEIKEIIKDLKK